MISGPGRALMSIAWQQSHRLLLPCFFCCLAMLSVLCLVPAGVAAIIGSASTAAVLVAILAIAVALTTTAALN